MMDMDFAPPEPSNRDRLLMLRKRLRDEMEALRGILKKAELLANSKIVDEIGRPAPRRGKDGRFLNEGDRSDPTEADKTASAKSRKTMPMPSVEAVEHRMAAWTTSAKRRKIMPVLEIVEPRVSKDEIASVATRVSSLASDMPAHILEFLKKECTGHLDEDAGEIAIDLGSMRRSAMPELQKLLDEFAEEEKRRYQNATSMNVSAPISCLSPRKTEEGEIAEEDCDDTVDVCGDTSPVAAAKVLCSPLRTFEDGEIAEEEEEEAVGCGAAAAVESEKKIEAGGSTTCNSPISSSSSGSSSSSSSSSGSSTSNGSSSSGSSSSSDSSDSDDDDDDETVTSRPVPAVVPTADASAVAATHKALISSLPCSLEDETGNIPRGNSSSSSLLEDGEIEEKQEGNGTSPVTTPKSGRVGSLPAHVVCAKPPLQQSRSVAPGLVAKGNEKKRMLPCSQERKRSPARVVEKKNEKMRSLERQRFYKMLKEKERNAKPIFDDWIDPVHLRQLGITPPVEYAVTSERRVPGRGCPVQRLLGLSLKEE
ncbi:hypothetical protein BS78_10G086300, partial [Paspalum vaginatum]